MDTIDQVELVIRKASAGVLLDELLPQLVRTGWDVTVVADGGERSLRASKGAGQIFMPGGRGGLWRTQVTEIEPADTTPAGRPVWRVHLDQSTPVDLILTVAERAADGPGGVLV